MTPSLTPTQFSQCLSEAGTESLSQMVTDARRWERLARVTQKGQWKNLGLR